MASEKAVNNRLYVANLNWAIDDAKLAEIFSEFGKVAEARVVRDRYRNLSRGYGFVTFESDEDAQKAVSTLNGNEVEGREIRLEVATSTGPHPPGPLPESSRGRGGFRGRGRGGFRGRGRGGFRGRGRGFRGRGRGFRGRGNYQGSAPNSDEAPLEQE